MTGFNLVTLACGCCLGLLLTSCGVSSSDVPSSTVIIDSVNAPWIFVPIGPDNVTSLVLQDRLQPWVLYFHSGLVYQPFKEAASRLRGLIGFGLVHREDRETAEILGMDPSADARLFRALPFGSEEEKLSGHLDTDVFDAAVNHASQSVPDDSIVRLTGEETLGQLLAQGVEAEPSKFTVIFTIRDATPTLLHRVLSKKLALVYNFAVATRVQPGQALDGVGLPGVPATVPGLLVVQPRPDGDRGGGGGSVDVARLDESGIATPDELVYAEALRYLVEYNRQFRAELPGRNQAEDASVVGLSGLLRRERLAFNIVDWMTEQEEASRSAAGREEF